MREILFKAKRLDNSEWVQGFYFRNWDKHYILWGTTNYAPNMVEIDPETLCQYTELEDKNGNKIFEGDVLRIYGEDSLSEYDFIANIEFGNPNYGFDWGYQLVFDRRFKHNIKNILCWIEMQEKGTFCEIIGNIHDKEEK